MKTKEILKRAENTMLALNRLVVPGARAQGLSLIASFKREIDTEMEKEIPATKKPAPKKAISKTKGK